MTWNNYFLNIAKAVAEKSKDPSTKVGCVIVDKDKRPVSFGFNGFIKGCNESKMTNDRPMKYHLVCHAEMNAILFARRDLNGCVLYCTHAPCENCLKYILQSGIRIIYYSDSDPTVKRGSIDQLESIILLMSSTNAKIMTTDGRFYIHELKQEVQKRCGGIIECDDSAL